MNILTAKWPYVVNGMVLAILIMLGLFLFDVSWGGDGETVQTMSAYASAVGERGAAAPAPPLQFPLALALGLVVGALAGSLLNGNWKLLLVFEEETKFGWKMVRTAFFGIVGGFLMMLGALLAGATADAQIASAMELAPGAWLYLITFFGVGALTALLLERHRDGQGATGAKGKGKGEA